MTLCTVVCGSGHQAQAAAVQSPEPSCLGCQLCALALTRAPFCCSLPRGNAAERACIWTHTGGQGGEPAQLLLVQRGVVQAAPQRGPRIAAAAACVCDHYRPPGVTQLQRLCRCSQLSRRCATATHLVCRGVRVQAAPQRGPRVAAAAASTRVCPVLQLIDNPAVKHRCEQASLHSNDLVQAEQQKERKEQHAWHSSAVGRTVRKDRHERELQIPCRLACGGSHLWVCNTALEFAL